MSLKLLLSARQSPQRGEPPHGAGLSLRLCVRQIHNYIQQRQLIPAQAQP
jgi:hypothetical protein